MKQKNIVVLISGSGSNLQAFIDAQNTGLLNAKISGVISNKPDAYGLVRAREAGIDTVVVEHNQFPSRESFDQAIANQIDQFQPDLIILAGFMRILSKEFVQKYRSKLLNIHPSLLPKYPGLHTHQRAMHNKDELHGSSVHFVTEELDGGPVVAQAQITMNSQEEEKTVVNRILKIEHQLYPLVAAWFLNEKLSMKEDGVYFEGEKLEKPILLNFSSEQH